MTALNHVRLLDVAVVLNGKTPSREEQRDSGHPVLKIKDTDEFGYFRGNHESFVDESFASSHAERCVRFGDTLILNAAHNASHVASKVYRAERKVAGALATGEWLIIRPVVNVLDPSFLSHWVSAESTRDQLRLMVKGIHLYPKDVARLQIPFPPLPEQRRITAILDQADALRVKRRGALAYLNDMAQAIFLDLVGDPYTNPKNWPFVNVGSLCRVRGGKRLPKGGTYASSPTCHPYIRVTDMKNLKLSAENMVYLRPEDQKQVARYTVNESDLIISIAGTIGATALVPRVLDGANLTENAAKLVAITRDRYEATYLNNYLQTSFAQEHIGARTGQATIGKLALFRIEQIPVMLPPIEIQREFSALLCRIDGVESRAMAHKKGADFLFASLQHRAFTGAL